MIKLKNSAGFSLVELMIVVAIMAILAAIAIPSYLRFQLKARESEARINLAAIRTAEEAFKAEQDTYQVCAASPAAGGTDATPDDWADAGGFDTIGFEPDGQVRYQYAVAAGGDGITTSYTATATGDVDENGTAAVYTVTESVAKATKAPADEY
ncbi:prepilin-type N-terminal cleavage/methylation domain-containing protein [Candidatus Poribacteria bacterium]|nr:prepilin-type N-terminal cleavage/methylation domain-containing protein [Candidatus Poribacteria bacterium]